MGHQTAPAADDDVDSVAVTRAMLDEDFYRADYDRTTRGLISDEISYEDVMKTYEELIAKVFGT